MHSSLPFARVRLHVDPLEDRSVPAVLTPAYSATFDDAVTADNAFGRVGGKLGWTIDAGADNYQTDTYERPTAQTYQVLRGADGVRQFAAVEYFENLDIESASVGYDSRHLYVAIKLVGLDKRTEDGGAATEGLKYRYGFRLANQADGGGGFLIVADQPQFKNDGFGGEGTFIYKDLNGDVGGTGLAVTKQDRPAEVNGNGYERAVAADGRLSTGARVLWARVSPTDPTVVEFALDYTALGFTADQLQALPYLQFEANKGTQDPGNYLWNDEYTESEAGSPYRATYGDLSKSEFGTQGLGNIYELDTLSGGPILPPSPPAASISGSVLADFDLSGTPSAGDLPIVGVMLTLTGTDDLGRPVSATATTDADGRYRFEGLRPGTYTVTESQPADFLDGPEVVGSAGGDASENDRIGGIVLGSNVDAFGYDFLEYFLGDPT